MRSRRRLDYAGLDGEQAQLLQAVGELRERRERERGGVRLPSPRQTVVRDPAQPCGYRLEWERKLPAEDWNAQISLLAGMAAAAIMLEHSGGHAAHHARHRRLPAGGAAADGRRAGRATGPSRFGYADFVRDLDPADPRHAALIEEAHGVMGRAGYTAFSGAPPAVPEHAALAAAYAHCTAPMRRLADRYVLDLVCDLCAGREPSAGRGSTRWAGCRRSWTGPRSGPTSSSGRSWTTSRRGCSSTAWASSSPAVVVDIDRRGARLQLADPPVRARLHEQPMPDLGRSVCVRLEAADPGSRSLRFAHCHPAG